MLLQGVAMLASCDTGSLDKYLINTNRRVGHMAWAALEGPKLKDLTLKAKTIQNKHMDMTIKSFGLFS